MYLFSSPHFFISLVELRGGKIEIDGINIANIPLDDLRGRLALVPQESTLFLGTLRDNMQVDGLCFQSRLTEPTEIHNDHAQMPS